MNMSKNSKFGFKKGKNTGFELDYFHPAMYI